MVIIIGFKQKTSIQETASIACKVTVTICSVEAQNKENNNILSCVMNWFIKTIGTRVQFSFWERIAVNMSCSYAGKCHGYMYTAGFLWTLNMAVMMHTEHITCLVLRQHFLVHTDTQSAQHSFLANWPPEIWRGRFF